MDGARGRRSGPRRRGQGRARRLRDPGPACGGREPGAGGSARPGLPHSARAPAPGPRLLREAALGPARGSAPPRRCSRSRHRPPPGWRRRPRSAGSGGRWLPRPWARRPGLQGPRPGPSAAASPAPPQPLPSPRGRAAPPGGRGRGELRGLRGARPSELGALGEGPTCCSSRGVGSRLRGPGQAVGPGRSFPRGDFRSPGFSSCAASDCV